MASIHDFSMNLDHLSQGSGFDTIKKTKKHLDGLKDGFKREFSYARQHMVTQKLSAVIMGKRATQLERLKALSSADAAVIRATSNAVSEDLEATMAETEAKSAVLGDEMIFHFEKLGMTETSASAGIMETMKGLGKKYVLDLEKVGAGAKNFASSLKQSKQLMTKGWETYGKTFAQGSEAKSLYWAKALGYTDKAAAQEAKLYQQSMSALNKLEEGSEEYMALTAKFATPSSRMLMETEEAFAEMKELNAGRSIFAIAMDGRWVGFYLKNAMRAGARTGLVVAEGVLGAARVSGMLLGATAIFGLGAELVGFALSMPVQIFFLSLQVGYDLWVDGISWQFADDILSMFSLSLETFGLIAEKLQEYEEVSKRIDKTEEPPPQIEMMRYDSEELASVIDFWGNEFIELENKNKNNRGTKKTYKKLKAFEAILKVPGRYVKLDDHPYETEAEVNENLRLEALNSEFALEGEGFQSHSLVASWFPKKEGFVRNLRAFPVYDKTFQWPSPSQGLPYQIGGNFSRRDMDPNISALFEKWAVAGTFGPVYNMAENEKTELVAISENNKDLLQWLYPEPNWPTAWNEINAWMKNLKGKRAIMYSDMLLLAPSEWLKEWGKDKKPEEWNWFWGFKHDHPVTDFVNVSSFEQTKDVGGRYTYHPKDRKFLNDIVQNRRIAIEGRWSYPFYPPPRHALDVVSHRTLLDIYSIDYGTYTYMREATPAEFDKYFKILKEGTDRKEFLDNRKTESEAEWKADILQKVWKEYIRAEKPYRTVWGYVSRYRQMFMQELMVKTQIMSGDRKRHEMAEYMKIISKSHVPLHINSEHRVAFMGMFAKLAYGTSKEESKFIEDITVKFDGILRNELITTSKNWKSLAWAASVKRVTKPKDSYDFPIMFGALHARMFVLNNPRVVVIAIKGTTPTSVTDWLVDLDFTTGHFTKLDMADNDHVKNMVDLVSYEAKSKLTPAQLNDSGDLMTVHRGFLRAARALSPGISAQLQKYFIDFNDIKDVFITGHSLGAGITSLMTMMIPRLKVVGAFDELKGEFKVTYRNPHAYMFSSPRVGDDRFRRHFEIWSGESAQIWIDGDVFTTVPPFLVPDEDQSPEAYLQTYNDLKTLASADADFKTVWLMVKTAGKLGAKLGSAVIPAPPLGSLAKKLNDMVSIQDSRSVWELAKTMFNTVHGNRTFRGGSVFLRLNNAESGSFKESLHDPGNSKSVYQNLSHSDDIVEYIKTAHDMAHIVEDLVKVAEMNPDLFSLDMAKIPAWKENREITDKTDPTDKFAGITNKELSKALVSGHAKIIGYGKSKHHHRPWSVVDKGDIIKSAWVLTKEEKTKSTGRKKRRRIDKSDGSYRGHDYL